jgi:hypothetical protein
MFPKCIAILISAYLSLSMVAAEKYYVLDITKTFSGLSLNNIVVEEIDGTPENIGSGDYQAMVLSDGEEIFSTFTSILDNEGQKVYIPYFRKADRVEIKNTAQDTLISIDVGSYSDRCGDKICQKHESFESCPADCTSGDKDEYCDRLREGICDPDCFLALDPDCKVQDKEVQPERQKPIKNKSEVQSSSEVTLPKTQIDSVLINLIILSGAIIGIMLVISFFLIARHTHQRQEMEIRQYITHYQQQGYSLQQIRIYLTDYYKNTKLVHRIIDEYTKQKERL